MAVQMTHSDFEAGARSVRRSHVPKERARAKEMALYEDFEAGGGA